MRNHLQLHINSSIVISKKTKRSINQKKFHQSPIPPLLTTKMKSDMSVSQAFIFHLSENSSLSSQLKNLELWSNATRDCWDVPICCCCCCCWDVSSLFHLETSHPCTASHICIQPLMMYSLVMRDDECEERGWSWKREDGYNGAANPAF